MNIRTKNINQAKADRYGIVYATTSKQGRKHEDIKSFTGLLFVDVDNCNNPEKVKDIFKKIVHTAAVWYSTSGNIHALIKIPVCKNVDEFKRRYKAFIKALKPLIDKYGELDTITSNPTQLAFESYDSEIYVGQNVQDYTDILAPQKKKIIEPFQNNPTNSREQWVVDWITKKIHNIETNGYNQLLGISKVLGGYCSGGYISYNNALTTLLNAVSNNDYMNSTRSSGTLKTYRKGAEGSFKIGLNEPIKWN